MPTETIRPASRADLKAMREIHNYYAANTHHTFDSEPLPQIEFEAWFDQFSARGPHRIFVLESGGSVLGYANSRTFHPSPVYGQTVETGIFVSHDRVAAGIGTRLYQALLDALSQEEGVHQIVASITLPNEPSLALHSKLGFREVGTFPDIGFRRGRRWSLCWLIRPAHEHE